MAASYVADIAILKTHRDHSVTDGLDAFFRTKKAIFPEARWLNLTSVHARLGKGKWVHVMTRGTFAVDRHARGRVVAYDGIIVTRWSIGANASRSTLRRASEGGFRVPGFERDPVPVNERVAVVRSGRWITGAAWSTVRLFFPMKPAIALPDRFWGPYGAASEVACSSGEDLVRCWTGISDWEQASGSGRGFLIECEDRRGRVSAFTLSDELVGELDIQAEGPTSAQLQLDLRLEGAEGVQRLRATPAGRLRWRQRVGTSWDSVSCFLVSASGEVIDEIGPMRPASLPTAPDVGVSPSDLDAFLLAGECGEREMKSWRLVDDGADSKRGNATRVREHARRAACAFANGRGGRLLVGVDESGELDGPIVPPTGPSEGREAALRWAAAIRSACVEEVNPTPAVHVRVGELRSRFVLLLDVAAGDTPPYVTSGGQCYVRDGAHTRPASHDEIVHLVRRLG